MQKYIIMGAPGSGKGTQAEKLKAELDLVHISVADIFRWNVQSHTKLGARIKRSVAAGQLVPDVIVEEVVRARLEMHDWNFGFILDGFPRSLNQAEFFLESYDVDAVIQVEVPDSVVRERILGRQVCSQCGLDYNLISHRPSTPGVCDVCGGNLVPRSDDNADALQERLADYHDQSEPVLELFRRKSLIVLVDGTRPPDEVYQEIRQKLGLPPKGA